MALRRQRHASFDEVSAEFQAVEDGKLDAPTYATRAPNSGDKGLFWIHENGSNLDFYIRHRKAGAWKKATFS